MGEHAGVKKPLGTSADGALIVDLLRGANRGPRDPDVELAGMLTALDTSTDGAAVAQMLERLARDANPH